MANDDRDILDLFYDELDFIDKGGYGRSVRTPWKPKSIFQDSLTCLNYGFLTRVHPCSECHLIDFVPAEARDTAVPCHHISLNETGESIEALETHGNQQKLEAFVKHWLRAKITQFEDVDSRGLGVQELAAREPITPVDGLKRYGLYSFDLDCLSR